MTRPPVDLLVDTGSSNTWVGAGKALVSTSTTRATGNLVVSGTVHIVRRPHM